MIKKGILAGIVACSMMILSGCGHTSTMVEAVVVNKQSYDNAVTVEYEGFYDVVNSRKIYNTVQIGQKIKVIKREHTDLDNKVNGVELLLP